MIPPWDHPSERPEVGDVLESACELRDAGELVEAEAACRRALETSPADAEGHRVLATILRAQERTDEAVARFEKAVRLDPYSAKAFRQLAVALSEQGRLSQALVAARKALELEPHDVTALYLLAQLKRFFPGDPDLQALEARAQDADRRGTKEAILLSFALGKAYEELGDYDRSFVYLERANGLKRETIEYDVAADVQSMADTAAVFQNGLFDDRVAAGSRSQLPVLIIGMPRSGTTLVEQILASHPAVHGGGELTYLEETAAGVSLLTESQLGFPRAVAQLSPADFDRFGHGYVTRLQSLNPSAARVTDKNPLKFIHLGLTRLIVPQAQVIHCTRDPVDTCLSCYKSNFQSLQFSYDLEEVGRYYGAYARLMEHWHRVLPGGWILEVKYEDLVADLEQGARRIVAHCGLDWDDACLAFHSTERAVLTASFAQVRRPLYRSAVGRWRRYGQHVKPLVSVLERELEATTAADFQSAEAPAVSPRVVVARSPAASPFVT